MPEFKNVTVIKKANIFFNGLVSSRSVFFADGSKKTLGVMLPGEFEFSTDCFENMEILSGELQWQFKGELEWKKVVAGESFNVPAHTTFIMRVAFVTEYCCTFS
ncbi:MAG TPA: pyrimidine/purine nucleoside phosphorylase [Desulfuromonadales bacterium]|nr:pyrimidine/purine nucleoside phosphorylase [Desulfuromonadales bacterium]